MDFLFNKKDILDIIIKIVVALICGGLIGLERDKKNKNAGIRTYMTVCLSTTIVMIIAINCFNDTKSGDITRMAAATIQGMGFLGAGLIINRNDHLEGITSAAIMWCTAIIGLAIGYGLFIVALLSTFVLLLVGHIIIHLNKHRESE